MKVIQYRYHAKIMVLELLSASMDDDDHACFCWGGGGGGV